jgi:hypothetical protein
MRRTIVGAVLLALIVTVLPAPARAGTSTDVALGLASFAVFNQVVGPFLRGGQGDRWGGRRQVVYQRTIVTQPVVYATPAPVYVASAPVYVTPAAPVVAATAAPVVTAAPALGTVIQYPHGRYELQWTGQQYVWVWFPTVPPPPPPPPAPPAHVPAPPAPPAP